jgi:Icc-related predicted phosphoesterase
VRIQYCSDLHLEFEQNNKYLIDNPLAVCGDILILAGDIVPLHDEFLSYSFFRLISKSYKQIFWVPGNHEYYYSDIDDFDFSSGIKLLGNISIINNNIIDYEGIRFVFTTLWSKISRANEKYVEQSVSDFDCITKNKKNFSVADFNRVHHESLSFLKHAIFDKTDKTIVVTHHLPSPLCNKDIYQKSNINEAFCSDLTDLIEESNAAFWVYGHSHHNQKPVYIGNTIMLTNQLGYIQFDEKDGFRGNAYFSI